MPKTLAPWIVAVAAAAIVSIQPAAAQKVRLFFTSMSPAGSSNSEFFNAWAKRVNDAAKGAIDVQVKDGVTLANFANVYDRVLDDVVQIGWGQQAFIRGRFPASDVTCTASRFA
jgi:TRAP-type C4-dicarboxylate transport system substrate-binding protein